MKYVKTFEDFQVSEGFRYHMENGLDITNSVYRIGSQAYKRLFEETKKYWDEGNIILSGKAAWMAKNLEVGKKAIYKNRANGKTINVELDSPKRGGNKKFIVYRNTGKKDEDGNIIAKKIEWGDPNLSVKNDDPAAAASFWARHQCDLEEKMNPDKAGFWACYGPSLFSSQLGLQSDEPW